MKIKPKQYAQALFESIQGAGAKEIPAILERFARLLAHNNQTSDIGRILDRFREMYDQDKHIVQVEIVSASKLDRAAVKAIKEHIAAAIGAKQVEIKESLDPGLIGGLAVKYADRVIDASLKSRLNAFREAVRG